MRTQPNKKNKVPEPKVRMGKAQTIHHVHILDSSSSMQGGKYNSAIEGINVDLKEIQDTRGKFKELTETMTIVEFSNSSQVTTHYFMKKVEDIGKFNSRNICGMTALYQTVGETIDKLLTAKSKEDKVVVKIFTDGEENASRGKYANHTTLKELIEKVEKNDNFTVTFVGTELDVKRIVQNVNINITNTLFHDNTADGVRSAFLATSMATTSYRKSVVDGEDVSENFYKKSL